MYSSDQFRTPRISPRPDDLAATKQRIQRQLEIVVELFAHNVEYLTSYERSWTEHVINAAAAVALYSNTLPPTSPQNYGDFGTNNVNDVRGRTSFYASDSGSASSAQVTAQDLNAMLSSSKSLDSVNSLLSCCYDRWTWYQASQKQLDEARSSDQVQHSSPIQSIPQSTSPRSTLNDHSGLLARRRVPQSPPEQFTDLSRLPRRQNTNSTASSRNYTTSTDGTEHSLYLAVNDNIDKWRQNAENALNEAKARIQGNDVARTQADTMPHPFSHTCRCQSCLMERQIPAVGFNAARTSMSDPGDFQHPPSNFATRSQAQRQGGLSAGSQSPRFGISGSFGTINQSPSFFSDDKEVISPPATTMNGSMSTSPPRIRHPSSALQLHPYSQPSTIFENSPHASQTTLVEPRTVSLPGSRNMPSYARNSHASTSSVQSRSSDGEHKNLSRGRRWLEHQSHSTWRWHDVGSSTDQAPQ